MEPIQIIIIIFALFALSRVFLRFKDEKISILELIFWTILWLGGIILVSLPNTTFLLANLIGIRRGVDVVVYLSIVILFYLLFRIYVKIETIEQDLTKVVRSIAINNEKKKNKKK